MPVTLVQPEGLPDAGVYRHVSVATGSRTVHVAGQVSWDATGATVGTGDLAAQVVQCYRNVATALASVGAGFADVVRLRVYVVDWTPERMPELLAGIERAAAELGFTPGPPASLIGVAALDVPDHLVEIEAIAVLD
ncbi:RidA family protein [Streptomyces lonarensis]|uniref:RidA family protein n=1 Tax=Streptomyces lonarensis TaxID=700599 RepID=A0A7X6I153_9ACTN|nr:RidA family protein [Streptomyces lonarensis]NJQ07949.1 RidA family protein [Streptomyces lonarensis]